MKNKHSSPTSRWSYITIVLIVAIVAVVYLVVNMIGVSEPVIVNDDSALDVENALIGESISRPGKINTYVTRTELNSLIATYVTRTELDSFIATKIRNSLQKATWQLGATRSGSSFSSTLGYNSHTTCNDVCESTVYYDGGYCVSAVASKIYGASGNWNMFFYPTSCSTEAGTLLTNSPDTTGGKQWCLCIEN